MSMALFAHTLDSLRFAHRGGHPSLLPMMRLVDIWAGDAGQGRALLEGRLSLGGISRPLCLSCDKDEDNTAWSVHLHGFSWLRDLRTLSGEEAATVARRLIYGWIAYRPSRRADTIPWQIDITGTRLSAWLAHYKIFIGGGKSQRAHDVFWASVWDQYRWLWRNITDDVRKGGIFEALCGVIYATFAFAGQEKVRMQALEKVEAALAFQILPDGGHISRSPAILMRVLRVLLDIRRVLVSYGMPVSRGLNESIDKMTMCLRFFRHNDRALALFHGTQEGCPTAIESILNEAGGARGRYVSSLPLTGYERLAQGRSLVIMDVGLSPPLPHDTTAHGAPLAFEFSYHRQRVFVACGSHPISPSWREALRTSPAHCTVTLANRGACEVGAGGHFTRRVHTIAPVREEAAGAVMVEAAHDGYVPLNGIVHRRRLYLSRQGHDLRGEEMLTATAGVPDAASPVDVAVRFHLHPRVSVGLIRDGAQALLRVPGGGGWRFHQMGAHLVLEGSVYLGTGTVPRKTKQLVLYTRLQTSTARVRWGLQREG